MQTLCLLYIDLLTEIFQGLSSSRNSTEAPPVVAFDGPDGLLSAPLGSGENLIEYQKRVDGLKKWFVHFAK